MSTTETPQPRRLALRSPSDPDYGRAQYEIRTRHDDGEVWFSAADTENWLVQQERASHENAITRVKNSTDTTEVAARTMTIVTLLRETVEDLHRDAIQRFARRRRRYD